MHSNYSNIGVLLGEDIITSDCFSASLLAQYCMIQTKARIILDPQPFREWWACWESF